MFQEQVACMLCIVEVVGIVDNAFDVALVVANLHAGFKDIVHGSNGRLWVFSDIRNRSDSAGSCDGRSTPSSVG